MSRLPNLVRLAVEPAIAAVYLVLWIVAEVGRQHPFGFWVTLALLTVAIGVSRWLPAVALGIVVGVPMLQLVGVLSPPESTTWPMYEAAVIVAFVVGLTASTRIRWAAIGAIVVQAVLVGVVMVYRGDWLSWIGGSGTNVGGMASPLSDFSDSVLPLVSAGAVLGLVAWTAGFALQVNARRHADQELIAQAEADLAVADVELRSVKERSEIAQEVHDVLAHSLAVVIAVADGSRFLRAARPETEGEQTDAALREIADTARSALTDLRGLLEALHDDSSRPQPALGDLSALVARVTAAGMRISVDHFGDPWPLTPAQELSVYRIVQESLTNALKHGGPHPVAAVSFAWQGEGLALTVVSDGADASGGETAAPGVESAAPRTFGLQGMKDRARLAGGWLTAERDADGAFIVTAFVPARWSAADAQSATEEAA
ncbi:sensor histidine kinase [Herbiconiux ginsengi]|uniref:histidine kinase n=1 Tax=Herbiconiux ginsengi TaxID=381665 RepID=A0A1H3KIR4_9MICO|nr:histidine kinase [Herbiconiux ginsengi]SDY52006.1 Signal transduction histidine kinase [Herbiconiux ginsengi]